MKRRFFLLFIIFFGFNILSFAAKFVILPDFEVNGNTANIPIKEYYSIVSKKLSKHFTVLKKNEFNNKNITKVIFHFQIIDKYLFLTVFLEKSKKRLLILNKSLKKDVKLKDNFTNIAQFLTWELRDLKTFNLKAGKSLLFYNQIDWDRNEEKKGKIIIFANQVSRIYINGLEAGLNNKNHFTFTDPGTFITNRENMNNNKLKEYHQLEIKYLEVGRTYNIILYKFNYRPVSFKVKLTEDQVLLEYLVDLRKVHYFEACPFLQKSPFDNNFDGGQCSYKKKPLLPIAAIVYGFRGKFAVTCIVSSTGEVVFAELGKKFYFPYLSTATIIAAEQCKFSQRMFKGVKLDYYSVVIPYKIDY
ncbi:hypothetical protein J7L48_05795 [bacterium]|nr:hypothetical protein [bacterium]